MISYVPAFLHIHVAKACLLEKINMVTASYISPEMQALDEEAKKAGLIIFNEIGLDPGIDHLQAVKLIHEIKSKNGKLAIFLILIHYLIQILIIGSFLMNHGVEVCLALMFAIILWGINSVGHLWLP